MSKNKDLAVQEKSTLATNQEVPDFLKGQVGNQAGMEDVEQSDLLLPRLGLCQSLSPQRRKGDEAFIEGLEEGQLFNTVTKEIYGAELTLIALFFFKNRIKYFDIDDGGGIDCISANGIDQGRISPDGCIVCKFSRWGNGETDDEHGNDHPLCTLYHNFMAYLPEQNSPIAVSYKSTGLKISKQFIANVRITRLPMYAKYYKVTTVEMRDGKNLWYEKKLTPGEYVSPELFKAMETQFNQLKQANIVLDHTGEAEDTSFDVDGKTGSTAF